MGDGNALAIQARGRSVAPDARARAITRSPATPNDSPTTPSADLDDCAARVRGIRHLGADVRDYDDYAGVDVMGKAVLDLLARATGERAATAASTARARCGRRRSRPRRWRRAAAARECSSSYRTRRTRPTRPTTSCSPPIPTRRIMASRSCASARSTSARCCKRGISMRVAADIDRDLMPRSRALAGAHGGLYRVSRPQPPHGPQCRRHPAGRRCSKRRPRRS